MKKKLKWIFGAFAGAFVLLQFTNPPRVNPPASAGRDFLSGNSPPRKIAAMLRASCYDCHSNETKWPWYSRIAPMSWQIADDVKRGRANLNLSDWPNENPSRAAKRLEDMSEEIGYGEMPPGKYTLIHTDARLTPDERKQLTGWLDGEAGQLKLLAKTIVKNQPK